MVDGLAVFIEEIGRHRPATLDGIQRPIHACQRHPCVVLHLRQALQQPAGETLDARMDGIQADRSDVFQSDLHCRYVQVVQRTILEGGRRLR